jgi:CRP/FNR family transcriptional regulator, anaerobic regulatory protein
MAPSDAAIGSDPAGGSDPVRGAAGVRSEAPPGDVEALLGIGITLEKAAGQTLLVEGDPRSHAYRILAGAVRLFKALPDGRRQVLDFGTAGECFGLIGAELYSYSVEAVVRTTVSRHPLAQIEGALEARPRLAIGLLELARADLERARAQMLLLGRKSAEERVAAFLVRFAERGCRPVVRLPISRQDIADYLGLTVETVSRTLSQFRRDGLIAQEGRHELILERPRALEALANAAEDRRSVAQSSSNRMRSAAPSGSSNWPLWSAHRKAQSPSSPSPSAIGTR